MATTALGGFGSVSSAPATSILPDAAIYKLTNIAGVIQGDNPALYVPYNSTRPAAQIVKEGAEITESDTQPLEMAIRTQKVAILSVFSNESNAQSTGEPSYVGGNGTDVVGMITTGLTTSIIQKMNAIFWQNPAPESGKPESVPTGLFNYPGIVKGGNITDALDPIIDAMATVSNNGGTPTHLVMNYGSWAYLLKMRLADGTPQIAPDVANAPTPTLFGLPVYLDPMAPDGKILIHSMPAVYSATGPINAQRSSERYFERDSFGMRLTVRIGWGVPYPDRLAVVTINKTTTK